MPCGCKEPLSFRAMSDALDWSRVGDESVALLKELLCIDTTNPPGNEKPAAELLARLFEREGIEATLLESEPGPSSRCTAQLSAMW